MDEIKFLNEGYNEKLGTFSLIIRRRAFAIPLVILLAVVLIIFAFMLVNTNVNSKKQRNSTILLTKAQFMAQAGIQHMKLKYKLLPKELFDATCMYYGFSPFYAPKKGSKFDQFDDASNAGDRYPEYLAAFIEDINSYENDPDGSATGGKTASGNRVLVETKNPTKQVKQFGGSETWKMSMGSFQLNDTDAADDTVTEWGYKIVGIRPGSMKKENDPAVLNGALPYIEQSITIDIEGKAKSNVSGQSSGNKMESMYRRQMLTETILLRRQITY